MKLIQLVLLAIIALSFITSKRHRRGDLNDNKSKIDSLNVTQERYRNNIVKYLHEYELLEFLCKKQVISRSYFKLYEMIYHEPIILSNQLDCFFICEAPGGFIDCVGDIRKKKTLRSLRLCGSKTSLSTFSTFFKNCRHIWQQNMIFLKIVAQ